MDTAGLMVDGLESEQLDPLRHWMFEHFPTLFL